MRTRTRLSLKGKSSMDITGLGDTTIRIGGEYPAILDISATSYSVMATFYAFNLPTGLKRAELRRKDECYGLFVFLYPDDELPDWWKDSEVVWSLPQGDKMAKVSEN